jgi:hypothetical protein
MKTDGAWVARSAAPLSGGARLWPALKIGEIGVIGRKRTGSEGRS